LSAFQRSSSQPVELTALSWSHYRDRFLSRDLPQRRGPLFYMYDLPREVRLLKVSINDLCLLAK
jgi:hypothetical protein